MSTSFFFQSQTEQNHRIFKRGNAKAILKQLQNSESSFEDLARTHSKDIFAEKGGDMGYKYYYELREEFTSNAELDSVFNMNSGETSDVIKTSFGWVIYRIDEAKQLPDFSNEETLKTARTYMERFERGTIEDYLTKQAENFKTLAAQKGFEAAAAQEGIESDTTDFFPVNYGGLYFLKIFRLKLPIVQPSRHRKTRR